MPKVSLVVPTIREESIRRFFSEWKSEFDASPDLQIYVIEDNPEKSFDLRRSGVRHFSWKEIDDELKDNAWIIPRRTDCVRNFGYYKSWKEGAEIMITLDDDCYPARRTPYLLRTFVANLAKPASAEWFNTLSGRVMNHQGLYPRGFPYRSREEKVVLCHGLWQHVPDFDGKTQSEMPDVRVDIVDIEAAPVPRGVFFPMCGMNVAVKRELLPAFYFPLMGQDVSGKPWGVHRFGDIWAGIFVKKIIDHLRMVAITGQPVIHHDRASNAARNMELEAAGLETNEELYRRVESITLSGKSVGNCYAELAEKLPASNEYFVRLKKAMKEWVVLLS